MRLKSGKTIRKLRLSQNYLVLIKKVYIIYFFQSLERWPKKFLFSHENSIYKKKSSLNLNTYLGVLNNCE